MIVPFILVLLLLFISAQGLIWTVLAFLITLIGIGYHYLYITDVKTKFFCVWSIASGLYLYAIFELMVIPLLKIYWEENLALLVLGLCFGASLYMMHHKCKGLSKTKMEFHRSFYCNTCQVSVPEGEFHSFWFNCCIGIHNQVYYLLVLIFGISGLLYSANLTLTSVCHPFTFYKTILLPDDCSDVYQLIELGLCFVSAVYSLFIAFFCLVCLVFQLLMITLGLTWREYMDQPLLSRICFVFLEKPESAGICYNWVRCIKGSLCQNRNKSDSIVL